MSNKPTDKKPQQVRVRYEQTTAIYASQFVLSVTGEEVIVNFSSGSLPDPATGEAHLPVHTRIALSPDGAKRLVNLLNQALASSGTTETVSSGAARLPTLNS
ncbi:DUF3467 domain-containing protein [Beggiatoa leptomitoformis]|uniref:DUF3467 domain-containing protein n=1 Tax=Beggiatoa leptomitoformis TaxID=288004 RepID=A0A2N9YBB6_9GAMM|nr:DUF3467 domain-containing protein [Beggiatoa leptomitoformis]ALG66890.1 DUF3467 domain-containing protein [Beggiatoa leptomitoformis]AUI67751.1 DUF3467 domain-containing protein [Beggiatoa leptomitoformis]